MAQRVKNLPANAGDTRDVGLIPVSGRSLGEGNSNPLQYSWGSVGKESLQCRRPGFSPGVGNIPWRRERQYTPLFLPGKSPGQRGLAGYNPWGRKESTCLSH